MKMRKTKLSLAIVGLLTSATSQAAFLQPGSTGHIEVTQGCSSFLFFCSSSSDLHPYSALPSMDFVVGADGNSFTLTSFSTTSVPNTAAGLVTTRIANLGAAGGIINDNGEMILELIGRTATYEFFDGITGEQPWVTDDTTGAYLPYTTGTVSNPHGSFTGTPLSSISLNSWSATISMAGVYNAEWIILADAPAHDIWDVTITGTAASAVPLPPALLLFGSGILGLVATTRRKRNNFSG